MMDNDGNPVLDEDGNPVPLPPPGNGNGQVPPQIDGQNNGVVDNDQNAPVPDAQNLGANIDQDGIVNDAQFAHGQIFSY